MDLSVFSQTPTALPEHRGLRCQASCPFQQMPDYSYSDCRLRQSTPAAGLRSSAASFSSAVRSSTCQAANPSLGSRSGSGPGLAQKLLTLCDNDLSVGQFAPCTLHHALCLPHEIFLTSKINSSLPTRCFTACRSQKAASPCAEPRYRPELGPPCRRTRTISRHSKRRRVPGDSLLQLSIHRLQVLALAMAKLPRI